MGRRRTAGFTLIELMMVIAILSILTTMAILSYNNYVNKARSQEMLKMTALIQGQQQQYFRRYGRYVDTGTPGVSFWPQPLNGSLRPWGIDCSSATLTAEQKAWCDLEMRPEGDVYYSYNTTGWNDLKTDASIPVGMGIPNGERWWVVTALGDRNGDGVYATFRIHSHSGGRLFIRNELE